MTNVKLTADITLANNASNQWKPIGKDINHHFQGVFDGQGYTISGGQNVGAIVGMVNSGSQIINCHNAANVSGNTYVGEITGTILGTLQNCSNSGAVTGSSGAIGGLVGSQQGAILNSFNSGAVTSTEAGYMANVQSGGISGRLLSASISNCYNSGTISVAGSSGICYYGAIGGEKYSYTTVNNCYYLTGSAPKGIGNSSTDVATETASKVTAAFTGGEVAYRLQSGQANQVWGQTLAGSAAPRSVLTGLPEKKGDPGVA
jgi:hypothetical protein